MEPPDSHEAETATLDTDRFGRCLVARTCGSLPTGQYSREIRARSSGSQTWKASSSEDVQNLQKSAPLPWLPISNVVTKKVGVTDQDLAAARAIAEKFRQEHEQALEEQKQLASELATKANTAEVAANVAAARAEAATKGRRGPEVLRHEDQRRFR